MVKSVAVIGLGAMGAPMAKRVKDAGFQLTVCDANQAATAPFAQSGVRVVRSAAECAAADLVIVMVATPEQVREVLLGEKGLRAGLRPNHAPLVALMGTMSPNTVRELEESLRPSGVRLIDAPVSGGTMGAQQGTLTIMSGGAAEDVERAKPVFACFGSNHFHLGPVGAAQTIKILNNILGILNSFVSAETYRLGLEYGLDPRQVARVFETGTGRNWLSVGDSGPVPIYSAMLRAQSFDAGLSIIRKDLELARELASQVDGKYPLIDGFSRLAAGLGQETLDSWLRLIDSARQNESKP